MSEWDGIIPSRPASGFDFDAFDWKDAYFKSKTNDSIQSTQGGVQAKFDFSEIEQKIAKYIDENAETIAKSIAKDAKASVNVISGNLKKGIKAIRSKFDNGGWIVLSTAPHAHLVEYGHGGPHPAPPHPYLRPALDKNIAAARRQFGAE